MARVTLEDLAAARARTAALRNELEATLRRVAALTAEEQEIRARTARIEAERAARLRTLRSEVKRTQRRADRADRALDREPRAAPRDATPSGATRAQIERRIYEWTRELRFRLVLDGNHPSGVSYTALLDYLADGGRDFTQPTVQLRQAVARALRERFAGRREMPSNAELERTAAPVILDVIERRFERGGGDIRVEPRSSAYVRQLRREGRAGQPVGVRTGALRARISRATAREVVFE